VYFIAWTSCTSWTGCVGGVYENRRFLCIPKRSVGLFDHKKSRFSRSGEGYEKNKKGGEYRDRREKWQCDERKPRPHSPSLRARTLGRGIPLGMDGGWTGRGSKSIYM
jgi:hypothetical protein